MLRADPERIFTTEDIRMRLKGQTLGSLSPTLSQLEKKGYIVKIIRPRKKRVGYRTNPEHEPYPTYRRGRTMGYVAKSV